MKELEINTEYYTYCRECDRELKGWKYRLLGYCHVCYWKRFPKRPIELPPLRRFYKGGWQKLVSPYEREQWRKPFDKVDERIDRENQPQITQINMN